MGDRLSQISKDRQEDFLLSRPGRACNEDRLPIPKAQSLCHGMGDALRRRKQGLVIFDISCYLRPSGWCAHLDNPEPVLFGLHQKEGDILQILPKKELEPVISGERFI